MRRSPSRKIAFSSFLATDSSLKLAEPISTRAVSLQGSVTIDLTWILWFPYARASQSRPSYSLIHVGDAYQAFVLRSITPSAFFRLVVFTRPYSTMRLALRLSAFTISPSRPNGMLMNTHSPAFSIICTAVSRRSAPLTGEKKSRHPPGSVPACAATTPATASFIGDVARSCHSVSK